VQITLTLNLPRDATTIPVARHIIKAAMENVGVQDDCVHDVEVALSEACANVLQHSGPGDEYEVALDLGVDLCVIRVIDTGRGFDFSTLENGEPDLAAERGRGVKLMHALADCVKFVSKPEDGTVVHLEKHLSHEADSLMARAAGHEFGGIN
jgi:serine/threonine-protein kinase RsbW